MPLRRTEDFSFRLPPVRKPTLGELGIVIALALAAAGFFFKGVLPGSVCVFLAISAALVFWTPVGDHFGWSSRRRNARFAEDQAWRPSQHGLLGNALHYMDQTADEQMRRAAQPEPPLAQDDDRLNVATYGEEQKEIQRRAEQRAKENVDLQDRRAR